MGPMRRLSVLLLLAACEGGDAADPDAATAADAPPGVDADLTPHFGVTAGRVSVDEVRRAGLADVYNSIGIRLHATAPAPWETVVQREGSCRLLEFRIGDCGTPCEQGWCIDGTCRTYPDPVSAGTLTFTGLEQPLTLEPDAYGVYYLTSIPPDLFDPGATVGVSAAGAAFPAFTASVAAPGPIAPREITQWTTTLTPGADLGLGWDD